MSGWGTRRKSEKVYQQQYWLWSHVNYWPGPVHTGVKGKRSDPACGMMLSSAWWGWEVYQHSTEVQWMGVRGLNGDSEEWVVLAVKESRGQLDNISSNSNCTIGYLPLDLSYHYQVHWLPLSCTCEGVCWLDLQRNGHLTRVVMAPSEVVSGVKVREEGGWWTSPVQLRGANCHYWHLHSSLKLLSFIQVTDRWGGKSPHIVGLTSHTINYHPLNAETLTGGGDESPEDL